MASCVRRLRTVALVSGMLVSWLAAMVQPVSASTILFRTDAQLVAASERVVHGRVLAQRAERGVQGRIYTVTTLQILEDLTGVPGATVEIWELGGVLGEAFFYVGGAVEYRVGEEVLVCLERGPLGYRSVAMGFSKFEVLAEVAGRRELRRNTHDTVVVGGAATARPSSLSDFRDVARQVTGRAPQAGLAADLPMTAAEPFTLLGGSPGYRWREADFGTPVVWYKNTSAPPPLLSGNADSEIQTALAGWTNPASASIILQYGGTTFQSSPEGPWSGIPGNSSVITFEDPNNEISGLTLAIGGGYGASGAGGTVNGNTFNGFTRGYVIFQNAADLSTSFRQSLNFSRVLEHEIGHAIGLGHTQTNGSVPSATSNIMYPSCCAGETPVPPAIGADDLAGLNYIYPAGSSGGTCTYSIAPTSASASATGGSGVVTVSTASGCAWTASGGSGFITITGGASGSGGGTVQYSVAANGSSSARSGTLTIAGLTFTVNQQGTACSYALNPAAASIGAGGGSASVAIAAPAGCAWTAASNVAFISITSGASGSGNGVVTYSTSANGTSGRVGTMTIGGQTFTLTQNGTGPTLTPDKTTLRYGATITGTTVTSQTTAQPIRLAQGSGSPVTWTASSNQSWLVVSPTSGSGTRELSITVQPNGFTAPNTLTGRITITSSSAGNVPSPIDVTLTLMPTGTSANSFGVIDTPADNATGVTGAIPVTGWALDDVEVANVFICRAGVAGEAPPFDPNCGGAAQIFVGTGVFIDGTRPDVQAGAPAYPRSSRAGWGFMVLTNMLPNGGNGSYQFYAYAMDRDGHVRLLGTRYLTCDNAHATAPFGTIDTPGQGDTASGSSYVNFGWALTQQPKIIPQDGSTMMVFVDGAAVGSPSYNHFRSDIAALFPGYANSNGAIGFRVIDTTALANGLHTISWVATDSAGMTGGLGSRFFRVSNSAGALTAAAESRGDITAPAVAALPLDASPIRVRRGWNLESPWRLYGTRSGRAVVRGEELDRFEIDFAPEAAQRVSGFLRVGDALAPLPVGSSLDAATGRFTWSPGLGFVGAYDLVFVRSLGAADVGRQEVQIVLHAKGSGRIGPQVTIDTPTTLADVGSSFLVAGWAIDLGAGEGTGIDLLHAWAYPLSGGAPIFVGAATYGGARPDVAAVYGEQFRDSGYGFSVQGLPPGGYDVAVFAWSNVASDFVPAKLVRITVR